MNHTDKIDQSNLKTFVRDLVDAWNHKDFETNSEVYLATQRLVGLVFGKESRDRFTASINAVHDLYFIRSSWDCDKDFGFYVETGIN